MTEVYSEVVREEISKKTPYRLELLLKEEW